jgi:hypothetical protein
MTDDAFVGLQEFREQFEIAQDVIEESGGDKLTEEQERLRSLVSRMADADHGWATQLINFLPKLTAPPPPPSPLMLEALRIQREAALIRNTREETIAALEQGRRKIWEIADRATKEDGAHIRGLTRTLDHLQDSLEDPFWEFPEPPVSDDRPG